MTNSTRGSSTLTWVTFDSQEIEQARLVIKQLEGDTTVDKLGLGNPVEKISDIFFPGTSTLHTSLRYNIFVPAIIASLYTRKRRVLNPADELRKAEYSLQNILLDSGMKAGVIGRTRGEALKYWPSLTYWNGFNALQIFGSRYYSREEIFRILGKSHELSIINDDGVVESEEEHKIDFDPEFLAIARDLFKDDFGSTKFTDKLTFSLTKPEARYIANKYLGLHKESLSAHLVQQNLSNLYAISNFSEISATGNRKLDNLIEQSKIFSIVSAGITHTYRTILCDYLCRYVLSSARPEADTIWESAKYRNLNHLKKWCSIRDKIPQSWRFESLESAFKEFSDVSLDANGLGSFVDVCLSQLTHNSDPDQIVTQLTNTIQFRENSIKKSRSHFKNRSIPIPRNVLGEGETTALYMFDYRWWFGHSNAKDIVEALNR